MEAEYVILGKDGCDRRKSARKDRRSPKASPGQARRSSFGNRRSPVTWRGGKGTLTPGPMASQARHKSGAPSRETGSRNVVPSDGRGRVSAGGGVPRTALPAERDW